MAQVLTTAGLQRINDYLDTGAGNVALEADWYVFWGTSTTAPASGQTGLLAGATEAAQVTTATQPTATSNQHVATLTAGTGKSVAEAGLFTTNSTATATMIIRGTHAAVPLLATDQIQYTFTLSHTT